MKGIWHECNSTKRKIMLKQKIPMEE